MIGISIRIYNFPNALSEINCDEIMTIVNSKSIVDSGADIGGISFPVYLHAWGGQSVILLYFMALSIKILGYTLFAIRLPMILASIISLFVFYDLCKKISKSENLALIALGLVVISPWHILQSIWALDCNMFPHFLLFSIDLLYTGLDKNKNVLIYISMIFFALSLYCYGVAIYFVPLFLFILVIYLLKTKKIKPKQTIMCIAIFFVIGLPIITMFFINAFHINNSIHIGPITIPYYESLTRTQDMIFFSEKPIKQLSENFMQTLNVIFVQDDTAVWNAPKLFGTTYRITLIFAIVGIVSIIKKFLKDKKQTNNFMVITWICVSFITGLVVNKTNINRLNSIWYVILILAMFGIYSLHEKIKWKKTFKISMISVYWAIFITFSIYFYGYYVNVIDESGAFSRGFYQALNYVNCLDENTVIYDNIRNDGCLKLYIDFNNNDKKTYKEICTQDELDEKMRDIGKDEVLIIDIEQREYGNLENAKKFGKYIISVKEYL